MSAVDGLVGRALGGCYLRDDSGRGHGGRGDGWGDGISP